MERSRKAGDATRKVLPMGLGLAREIPEYFVLEETKRNILKYMQKRCQLSLKKG